MFRRAAEAAARVGNCSPRYVCPVCLKTYPQFNDHELSREHVPSKALGGTPLLLTCTACNNTAGHRLQRHQVERERQESFWRGDGKVPLNFEHHARGGTVRGEIESAGEACRFRIDPSRTAPSALDSLYRNGSEKGTFTLGRPYTWHASRIADLRDAYLWVFAQYGYSLIAEATYNWVRDCVRDGISTNPKWAIDLDDPFTAEQQRMCGRPVILITSIPQGALVVANGRRGTILPTPMCRDPYGGLEEDKAVLQFLPRTIPVPMDLCLAWDNLPREGV